MLSSPFCLTSWMLGPCESETSQRDGQGRYGIRQCFLDESWGGKFWWTVLFLMLFFLVSFVYSFVSFSCFFFLLLLLVSGGGGFLFIVCVHLFVVCCHVERRLSLECKHGTWRMSALRSCQWPPPMVTIHNHNHSRHLRLHHQHYHYHDCLRHPHPHKNLFIWSILYYDNSVCSIQTYFRYVLHLYGFNIWTVHNKFYQKLISTRMTRPHWTPHQKKSRSSRSMKPCASLANLVLEVGVEGLVTMGMLFETPRCWEMKWLDHKKIGLNLLKLTRLEKLAWDVGSDSFRKANGWSTEKRLGESTEVFSDAGKHLELNGWESVESWFHLEKVGRIEGKQKVFKKKHGGSSH